MVHMVEFRTSLVEIDGWLETRFVYSLVPLFLQEFGIYILILVNRGRNTMAANGIQYSERYYDDVYEYRHVVLPPEITKKLPKGRLMSETEWRSLGVQQSRGWVHYAIHRPEPHILLYRRPKGYGQNGNVAPMQQ